MGQFNRCVILTPKSMSKSARALKDQLQTYINAPIILVNPYSKTYQGRVRDYVINWGYSKQTEFLINNTLNNQVNINSAVNKLKTFQLLSENNISTVEWTDNPIVAKEWYDAGLTVIGRTTLTGFGGAGIVVLEEDKPFQKDCKLYTKYKKKHEYRVHIFKGEVIDITQKKKKIDAPKLDTKIRNHHNGWVYCRSDIHIPSDLSELAIATTNALCLTHSAVDIIWNEKEDKCYVIEVNTAPGLVGTTLANYVKAIVKDFQG